MKRIALVVGGVCLALLLLTLFTPKARPDHGYADLNHEQAALERREAAAKADREVAEIIVKGLLRDPSSASFMHDPDTPGCGWVNARNGYGGMAGDQAFIVTHGPAMFDDGSERFANRWTEVCGDAAPGSGGQVR